MLTEKSVAEFISDVASATPTPGGGSVSALAGSLGTALIAMVCSLTFGKKKYLGVQAEMEEVHRQAGILQSSFLQLVEEDARAFDTVMAAVGMPKDTDIERVKRSDAIQSATKYATEIPLRAMQLCEQALALTRAAAEKGNVNSVSDAGVAALMLHAACQGAQLNVQINLASINDSAYVELASSRAESIAKNAERISREILKRVDDLLSPAHS